MDSFFVTVNLQVRYTVEIHAGDAEEAILTAYNERVPAASLYDIEKDVLKVVRLSRSPQKTTLTVELDNTGKE